MRDFVALLKDLLLSELTEGTRGQGDTGTRVDARTARSAAPSYLDYRTRRTEGTRGQGDTGTRGDAKEHLCLGGV
jgi:hypothetical protein